MARTVATEHSRAHPPLSAERRDTIRRRVADWFRTAQRPLPWREQYDPYGVWVSEIMLQQTQVDTVLPYYARWMARFPDVVALADAPQADVLKHWEGLGYYARARNLHRAAQVVRDEHGGRVPDTLEGLLALPGVGRYTAGAVASIAFNRPTPVVDGNVGRVLSRLEALPHAPRAREGQQALWALAEALVPPHEARAFNQGLMELGALVCRDKAPDCLLCPVNDLCAARAQGDPTAYPVKAPRAARREVTGVMALVERGGRLLMRRRPPDGLWGGLWEPPWLEHGAEEDDPTTLARLLRVAGQDADAPAEVLGPVTHGLTHRAIALHCYRVRLPNGDEEVAPGDDHTWADAADLRGLACSRMAHKALRLGGWASGG